MQYVPLDELLGGAVLGLTTLPGSVQRVVVPLAGATIQVFARGTATPVAVFSDDHGTADSNLPLKTASDGSAVDSLGGRIYVGQPQALDVVVSGAGLTAPRTIPTGIAAFDGAGGAAGALLIANNLSDVQSAAAARGNLGLGSAAVQPATAFDAAGAAAAEATRAQAAEALLAPTLVPSAVLDATNSPITAVPGVLYEIDISQGNVQLNLPATPADKAAVAWKIVKTTVQTGLSAALNPAGGAIASLPVMALPKPIPSGATVVVASGSQSQQFTLTAPAAVNAVTLTVSPKTPNFAYPQGSQVTYMPLNTSLTFTTGGADQFDYAGSGSTTGTGVMQGQAKTLQYKSADGAWLAVSADNPLAQLDQRYYHISSWIDMCAAPYNCRPGQDASAAVQKAINYANASNQDTTIYFSQQGNYSWTSAIQSGVSATTPAQPYAGQVVWPPRKYTEGSIGIRIKGVNPPALFSAAAGATLEPAPSTGTVLQSNASIYCSTTTTGAIAAGANVTNIAVNAVPQQIPKGASIIAVTGTSSQVFVVSAPVAQNAVAIPVYGQPASVAFGAGTTIKYAGWMFDAIAGDYFGAGTPSTNIRVTFEDIILRTPISSDVGGVNGNQLSCLQFRGNVSIETALVGGNNVGAITGAGIGVQFGPFDNIAMQAQNGVMQVLGYATGVVHSEHFSCDYLYIGMCLDGIQPQALGGTGHHAIYKKLLIQGCWNLICPVGDGNVIVDGIVDVDDGAGGYYQKVNYVVNDPNNILYGELKIFQYTNTGAVGFPVLGAQNVRFVPQNGRRSEAPWDDFQRMFFTANGVTYLGVSSSHHTWQLKGSNAVQTSFNAGSGSMKATTNSASVVPMAVCLYRTGRGSPSRNLRMIVTPTNPYYVFLVAGYSGNQNSWQVILNGTSNRIELAKVVTGSGTVVAQSATGLVTSGVQYTFDVKVRNDPDGPYVITPLLNGAPVLTAAPGTGQLEQELAVLTAATGVAAITSLAVLPLKKPIPQGATITIWSGTNSMTFTTSAPAAAGAIAIAINSATPAFSYPAGSIMGCPTGGYIPSAAELAQIADVASATQTADGLGFWKDNTSTVTFFAVAVGGS